jgi:5-methylcytosine-specific restriction endonuclease McrA
MAGAKEKMKDYLLAHVGEDITREKLREVAGNIQDWQRSLRQLRQETGLDIVPTQTGYILTSETPVREPMIRKNIDAKLRYAVLHRDNSRCQRCGRGLEDGVKLVIDHKIPVDMGGETTLDNLWTLCTNCNGGKQSFFSDEDAELIKEINGMSSAYKKLKRYFETNPNVLIDPVKLGVIAGVRDWERTLRKVRSGEGMDLESIRPSKENPLGGYIYHT